MARSIARQPRRLGILIFMLAVFIAGLLVAQAYFLKSGQETVVTAGMENGQVDAGELSSRAGFPSSPGQIPDSSPPGTFTDSGPGDFVGNNAAGPGFFPNPPFHNESHQQNVPRELPGGPAVLRGYVETVVADTGKPPHPVRLSNVSVMLTDAAGRPTGRTARTDGDGAFRFEDLAPGLYKVYFADLYGLYEPGWYGDDTVPGGRILSIAEGSDTQISYSMSPSSYGGTGTIMGQVKDPWGQGVRDVEVFAYMVDEAAGVILELKGSAVTGSDGRYAIMGLPPSDPATPGGAPGAGYKILFLPPESSGFSCQWFQGQAVHTTAKIVPLAKGETVAADAVLYGGGTISGTIRAAGQPLAGALVDVFDASGVIVDTRIAGPSGGYQSRTLAPGAYRIRVTAAGYVEEWYNDKPDYASSDSVFVLAGQNSSGVDIGLEALQQPLSVGGNDSSLSDGTVSKDAAQTGPLPGADDASDEPDAAEAEADGGQGHPSEGDDAAAGQASDSLTLPDEDQEEVAGKGSEHDVTAGKPQKDDAGEPGVKRVGKIADL